jgi:hypothetical protein
MSQTAILILTVFGLANGLTLAMGLLRAASLSKAEARATQGNTR